MNRNDRQYQAQRIRAQYTTPISTDLDRLRALDRKVKRPAQIFAWIYGAISSLVLGMGMTLAMNVIEPGVYWGITIREDTMPMGILIGIGGIVACCLTYPLYKGILGARRRKYGKEILEISEGILAEKE